MMVVVFCLGSSGIAKKKDSAVIYRI